MKLFSPFKIWSSLSIHEVRGDKVFFVLSWLLNALRFYSGRMRTKILQDPSSFLYCCFLQHLCDASTLTTSNFVLKPIFSMTQHFWHLFQMLFHFWHNILAHKEEMKVILFTFPVIGSHQWGKKRSMARAHGGWAQRLPKRALDNVLVPLSLMPGVGASSSAPT